MSQEANLEIEEYRAFTRELVATLSPRPDVLGLVALGSMAEQGSPPDAWSDHDFWLIVVPGAQERYRETHDWLPNARQILWAYRETEHGVKVVYRSGHLLEYAVFDQEELHVARLNRYRILYGGAHLSARLERLAETSRRLGEGHSDAFYASQILTNLLVGIGRYWRGERLSAHKFIKFDALQNLVILTARRVSPAVDTLGDNLDPARRFESRFPVLGKQLAGLMDVSLPAAAAGLLDILGEISGPEDDLVPAEAYQVVRRAVSARGEIAERSSGL